MKFFVLSLLCAAVFAAQAADDDDDGPSAFDKILSINQRVGTRFSAADEKTQPELFEGDIVMTDSLKYAIDDMELAAQRGDKYDALTSGAWTKGIIPYTFDSSFSAKGRKIVKEAIAEYTRLTCIKWVLRTRQRSYVVFKHDRGCYSMLGQVGGPQTISLASPGCLYKGIAMHEMMHCAGFYHEQSRRDRDSYIKVSFENLVSGVDFNFKKYRPGGASTLGAPYDKQSVMHYGNYAFSRNGKKTITSLSNPNERLGQRKRLSKIDVQQLNKLYKCKGKETSSKGAKCVDKYIFCSALKGYCKHSWVLTNCKKSCRRCPKPTTPKPTPPKPTRPSIPCKDKNTSCPYWQKRSYCTSKNAGYRNYMAGNCRKSCGLCI
eukprot:Seg98.3 transcript_id=Seg98.3/GoldUCD/mRNA.D3Y31 product="Zinc metalloproteinase nas-4" protein_id=Seg98.3/GoldUCD/D3Y31